MSYVYASNTYYWDGTNKIFSSCTVTANTAWVATSSPTATSWNYAKDISWPTDGLSHSILLELQAIDNSSPAGGGGTGNASPTTSLNFTIDDNSPTGTLTWPVANGAVSGHRPADRDRDDLTGTLPVPASIPCRWKSPQAWAPPSTTGPALPIPLNQTWITTTTASPWFYTLPAAALATGNLLLRPPAIHRFRRQRLYLAHLHLHL